VSFISYMFLVSLSQASVCLSDVCHLTCVTRNFINTAFV